jgi:hypothetical protein
VKDIDERNRKLVFLKQTKGSTETILNDLKAEMKTAEERYEENKITIEKD